MSSFLYQIDLVQNGSNLPWPKSGYSALWFTQFKARSHWHSGSVANDLRTKLIDVRYTSAIFVIRACIIRSACAHVRICPQMHFLPFPGFFNCTKLWLRMISDDIRNTSVIRSRYVRDTYVIHTHVLINASAISAIIRN